MDLKGTFCQEEEAAANENQVAPGDGVLERRKQRRGQPDDPCQ
jgi:hypothetical protein